MGIHSDSVYKDTTPNISAENELLEDLQANYKKILNLAELELEDSDGNVFGKIEDTADGGKVTLYDETGTVQGEIYLSGDGDLHLETKSNQMRFTIDGVERYRAEKGEFSFFRDINLAGSRRITNADEGTGASDPTTDAPDGWMVYETQAGNTRYIPFYT